MSHTLSLLSVQNFTMISCCVGENSDYAASHTHTRHKRVTRMRTHGSQSVSNQGNSRTVVPVLKRHAKWQLLREVRMDDDPLRRRILDVWG